MTIVMNERSFDRWEESIEIPLTNQQKMGIWMNAMEKDIIIPKDPTDEWFQNHRYLIDGSSKKPNTFKERAEGRRRIM